jgi:hypothetical protein
MSAKLTQLNMKSYPQIHSGSPQLCCIDLYTADHRPKGTLTIMADGNAAPRIAPNIG